MIVDAYDLETTGVDPKTCEPVQAACVTVNIQPDGSFSIDSQQCFYLKIEADEVPEGAYNVHGISKEITERLGVDPHQCLVGLGPVVLGYNNKNYDDKILRRYGAEFEDSIDLYVGTRRLKTEGKIPKATLSAAYQALTGHLPLNAHDALADVQMTLALIQPMMAMKEFTTFQQLVDWLQADIVNLDAPMPFGKHKGVKLRNLPHTYVKWLLEESSVTGDLRRSLEAVYGKQKGK